MKVQRWSPGTITKGQELRKALFGKDAIISFMKPKHSFTGSLFQSSTRQPRMLANYKTLFQEMQASGVDRILVRGSLIGSESPRVQRSKKNNLEKFYDSPLGRSVRNDYMNILALFVKEARKHGISWRIITAPANTQADLLGMRKCLYRRQ